MEAGDPGLPTMKPPQPRPAAEEPTADGRAASLRELHGAHEAQRRQAKLVRKLQAKVLQYRSWSRELEQRLEAVEGPGARKWEEEELRPEQLLTRLEEEQQRCQGLADLNTQLRQHLEEAGVVNRALRQDLGKLSADWSRARDQLARRESERRMEQEFFEGYLKGERGRLLGLWREVVTFRRHFLEMKTATDRP